ncbi:MAG: zinc-dependent alcohol dehydrogenase family protein [Anaerolineae bacterium]
MQAMVLFSPKRIEEDPLVLNEVADPQPGPGQVRMRVRTCGVCHTDLHTVEGELKLPKLPVIPGHQIVGVVDALGPGATRYRLGDRVGVGWLGWACGECEFCRRGEENLCPQAHFTGLHADGGYAEYVVVDERFAYPIPERFTEVEAAPLLCAGIIGYRSLRLSGIQPGGRLGLYGFGASAHIAIQVARHWGCEVYVFSRGEEHRRLAEELGAAWTGQAQEHPPFPLDAGITFAPAGWIVPLALEHLRPGGTLAINAVYMSPIPEMRYDLIYGERVLRSVANFTRQDAEEFLRLAAEIAVRTEVQVYPLAEANKALQRLKRGEIRGSAALELE